MSIAELNAEPSTETSGTIVRETVHDSICYGPSRFGTVLLSTLTGWIAIAVALSLFLAMALPAISGSVYTADDLGAFHLPLRSFYAESLNSGAAFDWCPDLYCGFYLTGEGQVGAYHPVHLLLYRSLPLSVAWNLECLLSYLFLFCGLVVLLRRCTLSNAAALFGATAFTFGGFMLLRFVHVNAVAVLTHLPWLLYFCDRLLRDRSWSTTGLNICAIALLTGSQLLLGYPQYVCYSLLAQCVWIVASRADTDIASTIRSKLKLLAMWSVAVLLGFTLAAIQLLPTYDALQHSARAEVNAEFSASGSLHPLNFLQPIAPYLFESRVVGQNTHELTLYFGAVPLLLAIFALQRRKYLDDRMQNLLRFALIVVGVATLLAIGQYGPIQRFLSALPVLGHMRFPCRAISLIHLAVAMLAGIGLAVLLQELRQKDSSPREFVSHRALARLVTFSWLVALTAVLLWPKNVGSWPAILAGPLLLTIAAAILTMTGRFPRAAIAGLIALTGIDLGLYGLSYGVYRGAQPLENFIAATDVPPSNSRGRVLLEGHCEALRQGDRILLRGWQRVDGYAGLEPARQLDYRTLPAQRLAGAKWERVPPSLSTSNDVERTAAANDKNAPNWRRLIPPLGRARNVHQLVVSDSPASAVLTMDLSREAIISPTDAISPELAALVLSEAERQMERQKARKEQAQKGSTETNVELAESVVIRREGPGMYQLLVDSRSPGLVVVSESFHPGWQATVEGASTQVFRVNGDFIGIPVPVGQHSVSLTFQPDSLQNGRIVSFCGLGLWTTLILSCVLGRIAHPRASGL
ncbi:MAG: YfhO family protein [Planctomycetota bacterium]|nr:YfhO family protein [Planctomycetota bacterium]